MNESTKCSLFPGEDARWQKGENIMKYSSKKEKSTGRKFMLNTITKDRVYMDENPIEYKKLHKRFMPICEGPSAMSA